MVIKSSVNVVTAFFSMVSRMKKLRATVTLPSFKLVLLSVLTESSMSRPFNTFFIISWIYEEGELPFPVIFS